MTWNLTLDILLVILILLFGPIGFMRGPIKELLVALGIAFGALLVEFWARPWGSDLDYYFDVGDDPGAFIVAMSFLMATTFIGGYGIGLVLGAWNYALPGRILGAVIAMLNGTLLVAFSLQYVRLFLLSDANEESLEDSLVIRGLLDGTGWILLAAAIAVVPVLLFALITNRRVYAFPAYADDYEYEYDDYDDEYDYDDYDEDYPEYDTVVTNRQTEATAETRVLPPRVPGAPEDQSGASPYKSEPAPAPIRPHAATRPLDVRVEDGAQEHFAPEEEPSSVPVSLGDTDPEMAVLRPDADEAAQVDVEPEPEEPLAPGYRRCQNCNAVLPPDSNLCPVCGHLNE